MKHYKSVSFNLYTGEKPDVFADGRWHSFHLDAHSADYFGQGSLDITVDSRTSHVKHILEFSTTSDYFLGGKECAVDVCCAAFLPLIYSCLHVYVGN